MPTKENSLVIIGIIFGYFPSGSNEPILGPCKIHGSRERIVYSLSGYIERENG